MTRSGPDALRSVLSRTEALLLDFDGPVCSVFAGYPAHVVAEQLRIVLADGGHTALPVGIAKTDDPFDVHAYAATLGPDEARYVEAAMTAHEVDAMTTAAPTPGAHDLIREWRDTGRRLAVVSNNSAAAVESYLHLHDLSPPAVLISARNFPDPAQLKPRPFLVTRALAALDITAEASSLIGDSITDVEAAHAVSVQAIGYANKPGKSARLSDVGVDVLITSMTEVVTAVRNL